MMTIQIEHFEKIPKLSYAIIDANGFFGLKLNKSVIS